MSNKASRPRALANAGEESGRASQQVCNSLDSSPFLVYKMQGRNYLSLIPFTLTSLIPQGFLYSEGREVKRRKKEYNGG